MDPWDEGFVFFVYLDLDEWLFFFCGFHVGRYAIVPWILGHPGFWGEKNMKTRRVDLRTFCCRVGWEERKEDF